MTTTTDDKRVYHPRHGFGTIVGERTSEQVRAARGHRGHPSPQYRIKFDDGKTRSMVSASFVRVR